MSVANCTRAAVSVSTSRSKAFWLTICPRGVFITLPKATMAAVNRKLTCHRQSEGSSIPKTNQRMIKLLITVPATAAKRFAFRIQATMLTISAIGGVRSIASPPRAVMGEPHPGCSKTINAMAVGATRDKPSPIFPAFDRG
jgi:hypothetical protein